MPQQSKEANVGSFAKKALDRLSINSVFGQNCCGRKCLSNLTFNYVRDLREEYFSKKQAKQSEMLANVIKNRLGPGRYMINGIEVCRVSLVTLFVTSEKRLIKISKQIDQGMKDFENASLGVPKANENSEQFHTFVKEWIEGCEPIPNKDGEFQAPLAYSKKMLYELCVESLRDRAPKKSNFYHTLKQDFGYLKFPREYTFAKCSTCVS